MIIIFKNFAMFQHMLDSLQVKQNLISSNRNFVYELSHKLSNDLKPKDFRKYQENRNTGWGQSLVPSFPV